jgi:DNA processing protein
MTEQDLFYLLALQRVEGVGDIIEAVLKQTAQLAAIDGGSMLLET